MSTILWSVIFLLATVLFARGQNNGGMGQYAALPWSLLWLNPSYTGFYGGLGNVGQLTPDSAYLFGAGGQIGTSGRGGSYNYGLGVYNHARSFHSEAAILFPIFCAAAMSAVHRILL